MNQGRRQRRSHKRYQPGRPQDPCYLTWRDIAYIWLGVMVSGTQILRIVFNDIYIEPVCGQKKPDISLGQTIYDLLLCLVFLWHIKQSALGGMHVKSDSG